MTVLISFWWIWAFGRAYSNGTQAKHISFNWNAAVKAAIAVSIWVTVLLTVSQQQWIHTFDAFPPPGLRIFVVLLIVTAAVAMSKIDRQLATALPIYLIIGFQAFRIPVELLIHQAASEGLAPVEMTYLGRNFDIVTGIAAVALALVALRKNLTPAFIIAWNIMGLGLLLNVVATAILTMPHPMQLIDTNVPNVWVTYTPFILLPGILVCSALFGHILVFQYLMKQKKISQMAIEHDAQ